MACHLGVASSPVGTCASPWARAPSRRPRCGVFASTGRPHHQPGDDTPPGNAPGARLADFAAALAGLTSKPGGGPQQAPRLPSLSDSAEVLQALAEVVQQQVALAQAQAAQLVDGHGYEDYDGYGAEDAPVGARLGGGGANAAKARALATLARDRREVLQEERRSRDGGARLPHLGDVMPPVAAVEGARGRGSREKATGLGVDGEYGGASEASQLGRGMSAAEEQRQQLVRSALASLRSARDAGDVGDLALWDAAVEDTFQRQETGAAGVRMAVHRFVPPPKARAVEAPLGALGLLSDEFVAPQQPESSEPVAAAGGDASSHESGDTRVPHKPAAGGVPADVDAILSSALSELGLSGAAQDGVDDRRITVSGEQMAAAVLAWQAREGARPADGA